MLICAESGGDPSILRPDSRLRIVRLVGSADAIVALRRGEISSGPMRCLRRTISNAVGATVAGFCVRLRIAVSLLQNPNPRPTTIIQSSIEYPSPVSGFRPWHGSDANYGVFSWPLRRPVATKFLRSSRRSFAVYVGSYPSLLLKGSAER